MPTQSALLSIRHHRERANKAESELATLREQVRVLREALGELVDVTRGNHSLHWDETMQHGAGCKQCHRENAARESSRAALAATEPKETT